MTDITIIITPYTIINYPAIGIGYLYAFLTGRGYTVRVIDLSSMLQTRYREKLADNPADRELWLDERRVAAVFAGLEGQGWFRELLAVITSPLVGFTLFDPCVLSACRMARLLRARRPEVKIIAGGPRVIDPDWCGSLIPPEPLFDAFVHGEGELALAALVAAEKAGEWGRAIPGVSYVVDGGRRPGPAAEPVADLDSLPMPSFAWAKEFRYFTDQLPLLFSRGCISRCMFCDVDRYWPAFRQRSAASMAAEVERQVREHGTNEFYFCDSLINANPRRLEEFCRLIVARGVTVEFHGIGITRGMTPELLRLMYAAGFRVFEYGVESGSQRVLTAMRKLHAAADIGPTIRATAQAGIKANIDLIVGFPGETEDDFRATCDMVRDNARWISKVVGLDCCNLGRDRAAARGLDKAYGMTYRGAGSHDDWSDAHGNTPESRTRRKLELYRLIRELNLPVSEYVHSLEMASRRRLGLADAHDREEYLAASGRRAARVLRPDGLRRIAVVDLLFQWPPDGGARTDVKEITARLARDYEVKLFVPDLDFVFPRGRGAELPGFPVEKVPTSPLSFNALEFPERLRAAVGNFAPDLVFFTDGWYMKTPVLRSFADYRYVIRFYAYEGLCLRQHGTFFVNDRLCRRDYLKNGGDEWLACTECALAWLWQSRSKVFAQEYLASGAFLPGHRRRVRSTLRQAAGIVCYNDYIREKLQPYNQKVFICPSGIDPDLFAYREGRETDLLRQDSITLLMAGRVSDRGKGYHTLRAAYDKLKKRYPQLRLMVTRETVYNRTDRDVITFDWQTQENLPALYAQADICVVPSVWPEPFGIVALEAMASGVPVVVAASGGLQHIVADGVDGLVFAAGDADDLAAKLELLISNAQLYRRVRERARGKAETYNWERVYCQVREALETAYRV